MSKHITSGQPIRYFTDCSQGQDLVQRFGDRNLAGLAQIDQAGLIVVLGAFVLTAQVTKKCDDSLNLTLDESAEEFVPKVYEHLTNDLVQAITLLEGITGSEAKSIIGFLVQ